jgi:hypothetical protein
MAMKTALALVWGGFIGPITGADLTGRADFTNGLSDGTVEATLKSAALARSTLAPWLVDGEMLAPIEHGGGRGTSQTTAITSWCESGAVCTDAPTLESIQGAWWRAPDGRIALIYRNANTGSTQTANIRMLPPFGSWSSEDCLYSETRGACAASNSINYRTDILLSAGAGATRIMYFDDTGAI